MKVSAKKNLHVEKPGKNHRIFIKTLKAKFLFARLVPPPTTPVPIQYGECPDDWIAWGSSCYFFETKMVDWDTASYFCQSERSGSLVSIHSFDENDFILNKSKSALTGDYMWIRMRREKDGK